MSPRRTRVARTSRTRPARRARLLTRRAKVNAARRPRRGVLLLVVLSLLVLFLMVGMAFVITAKQSEKTAKAAMTSSVRIAGEAAQADLLDEVLHQIIRDTNNPNSSLRFHSLLGDMYGNDGLKGMILPTPSMPSPPPATVQPPKFAGSTTGGADPGPTGGQMLEFQIGTQATGVTVAAEMLRDLYGNTVDAGGVALTFSNIDNAYNGQVLTFLSGAAKGRSTRIVGFIPPNTFRVMNFQLEGGRLIDDPEKQLGNARILINGRPFSGTGVGFNPWAASNGPQLNAQELLPGGVGPFELALMPNRAMVLATPPVTFPGTPPAGANYFPFIAPGNTSGYLDYNGRGGANESYDAADFQNMALALLSSENPREFVNAGSTALTDMVLPSFHRPELLNYWKNKSTATLTENPALLRRVMMRPSWYDHPRFTGSSPEFAVPSAAFSQAYDANDATEMATQSDNLLNKVIYGPWDVDNDNDGVRDSVWVDVGLPVMAGPNGKLVKPLVAVMVLDLDGRLNVNAHGTCDLAEAWTGSGTGLQSLRESANQALAQPGTILTPSATVKLPSDILPRGMGFGPAEISLTSAIGEGNFRQLLVGGTVNGEVYPGKYSFSRATASGNAVRPGIPGEMDLLSQISMNGWPRYGNVPSSFATPPDLRARYSVGLNDLGHATFEATQAYVINNTQSDDLVFDSPYELDLLSKTAAGVQGTASGLSSTDAPFSPAELESVLRTFDADAESLPRRLARLSGVRLIGGGSKPNDRNKITTDSYDLPVPNVSLPHEMESLLSTNVNYRRLPRTVAELYEVRVRKALNFPPFPEPLDMPAGTVGPNSIKVREVIRRLIAPELARGERLDVNRAIGNGRDDNNNGVVDEPGEQGPLWDFQGLAGALPAAAGAYDNVNPLLSPKFPLQAVEVEPDTANPNGKIREVDHRQLLARHLYVLALTLSVEDTFGANATPTADEIKLAGRLAQWAVNVVDFRDPDNIMTPFEYDVNPFDGWNVDGIIGQNSADDSNTTIRGFVWGAERPELLITETLSWHDRRSEDTASERDIYPFNKKAALYDLTDPDADQDYDQLYRPRGALFVELYNPWSGAPAVSADTHAIPASGSRKDLGVDLAKTHDGTPAGSPVWRLSIYKRRKVDVSVAATWDPDSNLTTGSAKAFPLLMPSRPVDRSIYFAGGDPGYPDDGVAFFNSTAADGKDNPVPPVRPGRMLVVGGGDEGPSNTGRYDSVIGMRHPITSTGPLRRIELHTTNVAAKLRMVDADNAAVLNDRLPAGITQYPMEAPAENPALVQPAYDGDTSQCMADVAIIDRALDKLGNRVRRPLSISEPAEGYLTKIGGAVLNDKTGRYEDKQGQPYAVDIPLDGPILGESSPSLTQLPQADWPTYLQGNEAIDPVLTQIRDTLATSLNPGASYGFIYLQRLANPLLPWNPEPGKPGHQANLQVNPYRTIDGMSTDLTVFNSRGSATNGDEEDGSSVNNPRSKFTSHERGVTEQAVAAQDPNNPNGPPLQVRDGFMPKLLAYEFPYGENNTPSKKAIQLLKTPVSRFNKPQPKALKDNTKFKFNGVPFHTLGYLNTDFQSPSLSAELTRIKPKKPFEWLTWNNRPYVSGNELILVPRWKSSELFRRFATADTATPPTNVDPYKPPKSDDDQKPRDLDPFNQIEAFFATESAAGSPAADVPLHLYRVLEYVHTPSLFAGTKEWLNPSSTMFGVDISTPPAGLEIDPRLNFLAPFNNLSNFRDPGRINLNTIACQDVWEGLFHGDRQNHPVRPEGYSFDETNSDRNAAVAKSRTHPGPRWERFVASRRGEATGSDVLKFDPNLPTFFANPFRAPDAGNLVPVNNAIVDGVEGTLLRSDANTLGTLGNEPLFAAELVDAPPLQDPPNQDKDELRDSSRNAFFKYQPMTRLGSLTTTRSNVYAVWITVGFFEVEDAPEISKFLQVNKLTAGAEATELYNRVYPEGYQFVREDGVDVGNTRRLRGFYIIDRTNMAGYEPGADHNVENVIRLRRRIE